MSAAWNNRLIEWKLPGTWVPALSRWIRPHLNHHGIRGLRKLGDQDLCWDDYAWLEVAEYVLRGSIDYVADDLADALRFATLKAYHGCRVTDAGVYHREGIRRNDPVWLANEVRRIVREEADLAWMQPGIEERLDSFEAADRDTGNVFIIVDDRGMIERDGNYLLYGSEWITCVFDERGRRVLRRLGVPTVIEIDFPLAEAPIYYLPGLARSLLQEWTRIKVNQPDWVPHIDFSFCLKRDVPPTWVVGHHHPESVSDPYHSHIMRRTEVRTCPTCLAAKL